MKLIEYDLAKKGNSVQLLQLLLSVHKSIIFQEQKKTVGDIKRMNIYGSVL